MYNEPIQERRLIFYHYGTRYQVPGNQFSEFNKFGQIKATVQNVPFAQSQHAVTASHNKHPITLPIYSPTGTN